MATANLHQSSSGLSPFDMFVDSLNETGKRVIETLATCLETIPGFPPRQMYCLSDGDGRLSEEGYHRFMDRLERAAQKLGTIENVRDDKVSVRQSLYALRNYVPASIKEEYPQFEVDLTRVLTSLSIEADRGHRAMYEDIGNTMLASHNGDAEAFSEYLDRARKSTAFCDRTQAREDTKRLLLLLSVIGTFYMTATIYSNISKANSGEASSNAE